MKIVNFIKNFFTNKKVEKIEPNDGFTDIQKNKIDKEWSKLKKMSGYGIDLIVENSQTNDLAIAMAHSEKYLVSRFKADMTPIAKQKFEVLIEKYKSTTENDGYRMKSHIINTHQDRFNRVKII